MLTWVCRGRGVDAVLELPVSQSLLAQLRAVVPRHLPINASTFSGGSYFADDAETFEAQRDIVDAHAKAFFDQYLRECGWAYDETARAAVHAVSGRCLKLCWPWEFTTTRAEDAECGLACYRAGGAELRVCRIQDVWVRAALSDYVFSGNASSRVVFARHFNTCTVPAASTEAADRSVVDLVSRLTEQRAHATFANVARVGVDILDSIPASAADVDRVIASRERVTRYYCNAQVAVSQKGGLYRFFVPGTATGGTAACLDVLKGFVSSSPHILNGYPTHEQAVRGGVVFHPPLQVLFSEEHYMERGHSFVHNLSDHELISELRLEPEEVSKVRATMLDSAFLREHGLTRTATRSIWPYRLALCRCIALVARRAFRYIEFKSTEYDNMICASREMLVMGPEGGVVAQPTALDGMCVLWDGARWAIQWSG